MNNLRWLLSGFALLALLSLAGNWMLLAELRRQSVERGNLIDAAELSVLKSEAALLRAEVDLLKQERKTQQEKWDTQTRLDARQDREIGSRDHE